LRKEKSRLSFKLNLYPSRTLGQSQIFALVEKIIF